MSSQHHHPLRLKRMCRRELARLGVHRFTLAKTRGGQHYRIEFDHPRLGTPIRLIAGGAMGIRAERNMLATLRRSILSPGRVGARRDEKPV